MPPPKPAPSPPLKLVLTTTSLRNVTIATLSDDFYYEVVTQDWEPLSTKIRRLDPDTSQIYLVAELKREQSRSGYTGLRFVNLDQPGENKEVFTSPEEFLEPGANDGKILGSFTGENGKRYRWQEIKGVSQLVGADDTEGKPLARFHKHHRHLGVLRMSKNPFITVEPELAEIMNTFIVSFLLAEKRRRS